MFKQRVTKFLFSIENESESEDLVASLATAQKDDVCKPKKEKKDTKNDDVMVILNNLTKTIIIS